MLIRTALALLLLLSAPASAQNLDTAVSAVVRISGTRDDTPVRGTGFVVGLDRDKATIVTASHVIEGLQQLEVTFAVDSTSSFPTGVVLGMDAGSPNGLAVFQVRGALPVGVATLGFELESRPHLGESLFLLGFPTMELTPRTTQRVLSARRGTLLLIDQEIGEGFSGGPVLQGGKVVGVVTSMDGQTTYAINAAVTCEALEGWGVKLDRASRTPAKGITPQTKPNATVEHEKPSTASQIKSVPPLASSKACVPGEEQTEKGIIFVRICSGTFTMGSTKRKSYEQEQDDNIQTPHQVTLSEFWIGKTEITNEQYGNDEGDAKKPATHISWAAAKTACERFGGRLPTEAEWEYAARAGSQTAWSSGDDEKEVFKYAWFSKTDDPAEVRVEESLHPVGMKKPNAWGLYDMHGNVWEWVADWFGPYPSMAQTNPSGPTTGKYHVLRGGSFDDNPIYSATRVAAGVVPSAWGPRVGFRCVRGTSH